MSSNFMWTHSPLRDRFSRFIASLLPLIRGAELNDLRMRVNTIARVFTVKDPSGGTKRDQSISEQLFRLDEETWTRPIEIWAKGSKH